MSLKRNNKYKIILEEIELKDGLHGEKKLEFQFENHDNLFDIIDKMQERNIFGDKGQSREFTLGIKLFSEIMLKNKDNPLFEELRPAFGEFMKKLKGKA
jgi:hypothetical protein